MSCKNLIIFCTNPVYVMGRSSSVHQSFANLSKFSFPFNSAPWILNSSRSLLLYIYACIIVSSVGCRMCVPWQWGEVQDQWDWICRDGPWLLQPPISPLSPKNISSTLLLWAIGIRLAVMEIGPTFSKRHLTLLCNFFTDLLFARPSNLCSKESQEEHEWCYEGRHFLYHHWFT